MFGPPSGWVIAGVAETSEDGSACGNSAAPAAGVSATGDICTGSGETGAVSGCLAGAGCGASYLVLEAGVWEKYGENMAVIHLLLKKSPVAEISSINPHISTGLILSERLCGDTRDFDLRGLSETGAISAS